MPLISVIMGVFNSDPIKLQLSIESILNQTLTDFEFIICEDCSTNESYKVIEEYKQKDSRIVLIRNQANLGLAATLNRCVFMARGEYIARQDDDDLSGNTRLEELYEFLSAHAEYAFAGSRAYVVDGRGITGIRGLSGPVSKKDFLWNSPFLHPTVMFRAEALQSSLYKVSKQTRRCEDYELFMRLYSKGLSGFNLEAPLYDYFEDLNSLKKRKFRYRLDESATRLSGFISLKLLPRGIPYVLKPLLVGLLSRKMLYRRKIKKEQLSLKPVRVLQVVSGLHRGGAETMLMNLYRNLDRSRVQFDFISHSKDKNDYEPEIERLGGRIIHLKSLGSAGPVRYILSLYKVIKQNGPYQAVHCHTDFQAGFVAAAACLAGVGIRICHAHSTAMLSERNMNNGFLLKICRVLILLFANRFCACSTQAGRFLFGKKSAAKNRARARVLIIKNAIDPEPFFKASGQNQKSVRKELSLPENALILLHAGRFVGVKNQRFLLGVVKRFVNRNIPVYLIFAGQGPELETIRGLADSTGLTDSIRFAGAVTDMPLYLKASDVFLLPSLTEGIPVSLIEAQAACLPCIVSQNVSADADLKLGLTEYLPLDEKIWADEILKSRFCKKPSQADLLKRLSETGYNIKSNIPAWMNLYRIKKFPLL